MCLMFKSKRKELIRQLLQAFPAHLSEDVKVVCNALLQVNEDRGYAFYYDHTSTWLLLSGERVTVPYRLYIRDELKTLTRLTGEQQIIYHCICSRSYDGYARQRHIQALLAKELPEWALPYIIKICDEYVIEILQIVYKALSGRDCTAYKRICALNLDYVKLCHSRMISYWNEYYRYDCYKYKEYIGKKLYRECFGYGKTGQKSITFQEGENFAMTLTEFEQRWLSAFAKGVSKKQLEEYVSGRGGHIWHIFSRDLLPKDSYLVGDAARNAYDSLPEKARESALFIEPFGCKHPQTFSMNVQESASHALDGRVEIFVAAEDFSWTYIKTHENNWCGPYFCRIKR